MKVSFVIPIFNHFPLINQLLVDINTYCSVDEIIVVDDCSNDMETLDGIKWWSGNYKHINIIRPLENLRFLRASNYGISKATGDAVCLVSSDVRVEDDLARIVRDLLTVNSRRLIGGVLYSHDTGWNCIGSTIYPYLEGWLLCFTKETWTDLGGFDERYCPSDMEDVDLSTTAKQKGYELYPLHSDKFRHLGGGSIGYSDERMAQTIKNKEEFRKKWVQDAA